MGRSSPEAQVGAFLSALARGRAEHAAACVAPIARRGQLYAPRQVPWAARGALYDAARVDGWRRYAACVARSEGAIRRWVRVQALWSRELAEGVAEVTVDAEFYAVRVRRELAAVVVASLVVCVPVAIVHVLVGGALLALVAVVALVALCLSTRRNRLRFKKVLVRSGNGRWFLVDGNVFECGPFA